MTASRGEAPTTFIVGLFDAATNLYHTSSSAYPETDPQKIGSIDFVALTVVPLVVLQEVPCVRVIAPEQLLFEGCEKQTE
jgi:hypothetical protein